MHKQYVFNNHSSFFEIRENASLLVNGLKNPWKKKKEKKYRLIPDYWNNLSNDVDKDCMVRSCYLRDKVFKRGLSKFCGRQPLKNLLRLLLNTLPSMSFLWPNWNGLENHESECEPNATVGVMYRLIDEESAFPWDKEFDTVYIFLEECVAICILHAHGNLEGH